MRDARDEDAEQAAQAFRPNARPVVIATLANVILAGLCLGVPYWRGHAQAEHSLRSFGRFAGCLLDGKPQPQLGLGLPPGERAQFAGQVMNAPRDWPARCRAALREVAPEEAIFLWPSVKETGADVRAAASMLDRELQQLARAREVGAAARIPTRPLLVLAKLQGMLTLLARAANADAEIDRDAVAFGKSANVIDASRLPIVAGASAALEVWSSNDGLSALALDNGGLSWLRLEGGKVGRIRVRRTSLLRGALRDGDRPLLVWAMPEARCKLQDTRCVQRATGLAYLDEDALALPKPTWIAGHPGSRFDRSVRVSLGVRVDLLARASSDGALEVRRFELPAAAPGAQPATAEDAAQAPPLPAQARFALPSSAPPADALLLSGLPPAVAYAVTTAAPEGASAQAFLWAYDPDAQGGGAPLALGSARGENGSVEACEAQGVRWIAYGSETELGLARVADGLLSTPLPVAPVALGPLVPRDDSRRDRVRVLCSPQGASVLALAADKTLTIWRCSEAACTRRELSRDVTVFDAALAGDAAVVGYARTGQPQLMLVRVDASGGLAGAPETPAPCWDPEGGMCGQPTLASTPEGLLLCARDGSDLLALESKDGGKRWTPLSSLQLSRPVDTDVSAPMQQHRIRKGLD